MRRRFAQGVGRLLAEVQRIKSEGDYAAARRLFEEYGVHFDPALRDEVVARVDRLKLPSYTGFVMPRLEVRRDAGGAIVDVDISYPCDLETQMLEYSAIARDERCRASAGRTAMLSNRLPGHAEINALSRAVEAVRAAGAPLVDLTESNPTNVGLPYPADLLSRRQRRAGAAIRSAAVRPALGARGRCRRLRTPPGANRPVAHRAVGEYQRSLQLALQAPLQSRRRGA